MIESDRRGLLDVIVAHGVAPKLAALTLLFGGLVVALGMRSEVFPPLDVQLISIDVEYPGASAEEVADSVLPAIEQACVGVRGLRSVRAFARDGNALVVLSLEEGVNGRILVQEVQGEIDRLDTLPEETLRPQVRLEEDDDPVLTVLVYGDLEAVTLRRATAEVQRALALSDVPLRIRVDLPRLETAVEVPIDVLWRYRWSIDDVAARVRAANRQEGVGAVGNSPVGTRTSIQAPARALSPDDLRALDISVGEEGGHLRLGAVADVSQVFEDQQAQATYSGHPALSVQVFSREGASPADVSDAVRAALERVNLPRGARTEIWKDESSDLTARLGLVGRNGLTGLLLVVALLSLCVTPRVAIWVAIGIPVSVFGALLLLGLLTDVSINQITLLALLLVLGIVVDDAIVVGENIAFEQEEGAGPKAAAVRGANAVALPVICAGLTNIAAFLPLGFVPGEFGTIFSPIALVVTAVLGVSLVEALLFLPSHLAKAHPSKTSRPWLPTRVASACFAAAAERVATPIVRFGVRRPLVLLGALAAFLVGSAAPFTSGRLGFDFAPDIEAAEVSMTIVLEYGQPLEVAHRVRRGAEAAANRAAARLGAISSSQRLPMYTTIGGGAEEVDDEVGNLPGPHRIQVVAALGSEEHRSFSAQQFQDMWRDEYSRPDELVHVQWSSQAIGDEPDTLLIEIQHRDRAVAERAASDVQRHLETLPGDVSVDQGAPRTTRVFALTERADALNVGVSRSDIVGHVRDAVRGVDIGRIATPDGEVNLLVRLPAEQRHDTEGLARLPVRSTSSALIPLSQLGEFRDDARRPQVFRRDGRNTLAVSAALDGATQGEDDIVDALEEEFFPHLIEQYPGLLVRVAGDAEDEERALAAMGGHLLTVLLVMYLLLAIPLRSYFQPFLLLLTLPIGVAGALCAHAIVGIDVSVVSLFGVLALAGVLVNDGLILLHYANGLRSSGMDAAAIATTAVTRRFRPVVLTTITTVVGLGPMILETSPQAQFMVPMALSLGGGLLLATPWILILIPVAFARTVRAQPPDLEPA